MNIVIYTIPDCPYSKELKDYLTSNAITFTEKDVSSDKDVLSEMLEASNKFAGVPFTVLTKDSGEVVKLKGFTQADFDTALGLSSKSETSPAPVSDPASQPKASGMPGMSDMSTPPAVPSMPAMPPVADGMPNMTASSATPTESATPVMPSMQSMPSMPSMPPVPSMPSTTPPTPTPPASTGSQTPAMDPQAELNSLLKDLESKASQLGGGGSQTAPSTPAQVSAPSAPVSPTPPVTQVPSMPNMGTQMPPVPDFGSTPKSS